jgi:hypothetical protein
MGYRLREGLSFCITGGRAIFLDIDADRYFGLHPQWDEAFQQLVHVNAQTRVLPQLIHAGILIETPSQSAPILPAAVPRALREIIPVVRSPVSRQGLVFILAQLKAASRLKTTPLGVIIAQIREEGPTGPIEWGTPQLAMWVDICSAFSACRGLRWRAGHCLTSSIAFLDVMRRAGMDARLVLGVSAAPFSAHCWVQAGDCVLNDRLENVRPFEPLLAI